MPKKKQSMKRAMNGVKMTPWMKLYKFALGGVVVMTILAVGAMVWEYYDIQSKMWMFEDYEELATDANAEINLIDSPRAVEGGLMKCGEDGETQGACVTLKLSVPISGISCQAPNMGKTGVTEAGCRAMAASMRSWAAAFRSDACQPGLMFNQRTITSDMLVDKVNKTMKPKPISIAGMHKCIPGLSGRLCRTKEGKWEECYTVDLKGACKWETEEPVNIVDGGKLYKYCAPTTQTYPEGGMGCYTGSASKPTVKICCAAGQKIVDGACE